MELENDLKRLLRPERPPAGFAARVMQRVEQEQEAAKRPPSAHAPWRRAVAAAVLLTLGGGAWITHYEIERRQQQRIADLARLEGERAKAEVLLALRITSSKVHAAREHVRELGTH